MKLVCSSFYRARIFLILSHKRLSLISVDPALPARWGGDFVYVAAPHFSKPNILVVREGENNRKHIYVGESFHFLRYIPPETTHPARTNLRV